MSLPHFDLSSFPSQLLWLLIASGASYVFNKFFFIPGLARSIKKRNDLLKSYSDDTKRMELHIESLRTEIDAFAERAKNESKSIIDSAMSQAHLILFKQITKNTEAFDGKVEKYDNYIKQQKEYLESNLQVVVTDVRKKVMSFISSENY